MALANKVVLPGVSGIFGAAVVVAAIDAKGVNLGGAAVAAWLIIIACVVGVIGWAVSHWRGGH